MKLLIAIPALNEESSIAQIIERSLVAKLDIIARTPVDEVEITVVSDGSTDHTVELASRYKDKIHLIVFKKNRGYGAAIKEAWKQSDADLLGFLDADGTCDPFFFVDLCNALDKEKAEITLGCRMNRESKMPLVRRVGNTIFALLLSFSSAKIIRDTSSGMRVIRRSCLPHLMPLPDGLHFTPAISSKALLSERLKIVEIDMPYHERQGRSKLSPWKDGRQFLRVIFEGVFLYQPARILNFMALLCLACAIAMMVMPVFFYLTSWHVEEWMIRRLLTSDLACVTACLLLCAAHLSRKIVTITLSNRPWSKRNRGWTGSFFSHTYFWIAPTLLVLLATWLVFPAFLEIILTGETTPHWSRFLLMSSIFSIVAILVVTKLLDFTLNLIAARVAYFRARKHFAAWFKPLRKSR